MALTVAWIILRLVLQRSRLSPLFFDCISSPGRSSTAVPAPPPTAVPHIHWSLSGDRCVRDLLLILTRLNQAQLKMFGQLVGKSGTCLAR